MRIACISAGKDSVAMLVLCLRAGIRFDHMYYVYMRGAEWDETLDYVRHALNPYLDATYHCVVEVVGSLVSYEDVFYKKRIKGKYAGKPYGFNIVTGKGRCTFKRAAKLRSMERLYGKGNDIYIGFAAGEAERANAKKYKEDKYNRYHFPLVEAGITEQQCYDFCKNLGLQHPFYKTARRMGCWQCACQGLDQLRNLYIDHPDKWAQLQKWQDDCPFDFKPDGVRVEDLARRFEMEGQQLTVDYYTTEAIRGGRR